MKIRILGSGCPKCRALEANVRLAVEAMGITAEIEKVTDIDAIMEMGVMMTPALALDDVVKSVGKVLTKDQLVTVLKEGN